MYTGILANFSMEQNEIVHVVEEAGAVVPLKLQTNR
jgi:hypothetical protein